MTFLLLIKHYGILSTVLEASSSYTKEFFFNVRKTECKSLANCINCSTSTKWQMYVQVSNRRRLCMISHELQ